MVNATLANMTNGLINATNTSLLNVTSPSRLAFLHNLLSPPVLIVLLSVSAVVVIMVLVVRNVMPVSHFLYANARIQARSNFTVSGQLMLELEEAGSLKEFRSLLKETVYGEELDKSKEDLRSFHIALEKGFTSSILELVELSPKKSEPLFDAYLMFFESKMLKTVYRAKLMDQRIDKSLLYPIGSIDNALLKHLIDAETIADLGVVMSATRYSGIFDEKYKSLESFEVSLDRFVLNTFVHTVKSTKIHDSRYIIDILNKKIDILNILAILKFRIRGIEIEKQRSLLIDNKTPLCLRFDDLIKAGALNDFVEAFKGLPYYGPLKNAFVKYEKDNALSNFENELYRFFKDFVSGNDLSHTLGPYPLFSYLIKRELELRNLFIVSRGIDAGFSGKKIKGMVI
ncbi:V-type ATPase subunit [Candidatus Woesearchaeota archaeon]|nr:V-type ATPase subunit [Candidatus Woesearchaeota archaeon]